MARVCKIEELYNYECKDTLLWREDMYGSLKPCSFYSASDGIYTKKLADCIFFGGLALPCDGYNIGWRIWEGRPSEEDCLREEWDEEV